MDIIRVDITGPPFQGKFPYRIGIEGTRLPRPALGVSDRPLLDACRVLRQLDAADRDAVIEMYNPGASLWKVRTTVAYGVRYLLQHPSTPAPVVTAATPATSSEAPPEPHKPRASPADKGRAALAPAKPKHSPRKPKPAKSGGRRGQRSAR